MLKFESQRLWAVLLGVQEVKPEPNQTKSVSSHFPGLRHARRTPPPLTPPLHFFGFKRFPDLITPSSPQGYDIMEDIYSTKTAAMNFLHELCKARAKGNLDMLMQVRGGVGECVGECGEMCGSVGSAWECEVRS